MSRGGTIFLAFCAGWMVYMTAFMIDAAHGGYEPLAFPFQVVIAALISGLILGFTLLLGLVFKIPAIRRFWVRSSRLATMMIILSVGLIIFSYSKGTVVTVMDQETGEPIRELLTPYLITIVVCYFLLIFSIAHLPESMTKPRD